MNRIRTIFTALFGFILILCSPALKADWVNLTGAETAANIAEIRILDDHIEVALEVYVGDLKAFEPLIPDDWVQDLAIQRPPLEERLKQFSHSGLRFVTETGETLQAQLKLVEPRLRKDRYSPFAGMYNPLTRRQVPDAPDDKRVLYAELEYHFTDGSPESLTISPPVDTKGLPTVSMGFIAFHRSVPVIDFRYLSAPSTLHLADDPWYSRFENPNLSRHHKDALMSFLYVEPYEVRHEILTRVKDLGQWMELGLRGDRYIEVDELESLKQRISDFMLGKNPVTVDGRAIRPILDRTSYIRVGLRGIQVLDAPERLEIDSAIVGVILSYTTEGIPAEVAVDWELFTDQIQRVATTATDPAGPLPGYLTPDNNIHHWVNFLKNYEMPKIQQIAVSDEKSRVQIPILSLLFFILCLAGIGWLLWSHRRQHSLSLPLSLTGLCLIAGVMAFPYMRVPLHRPGMITADLTDQQAADLLQPLLKNVYRAFDFRNEADVYDKLAMSVDGEMLTDIYLQNRQSMAVKQAGGALARVKEVVVENVSVEPVQNQDQTYALHGTWTAMGTVGHWGHTHQRKNRYEAVVTIAAQQDTWKIIGLELIDEQRLDQPSGSRTPTVVSAENASIQ